MVDHLSHDLADFMQSMTDEIAHEYDRIQKRVAEDPGTAGDQGEENWAALLRNWLPPTYKVVTKGRLLGLSGKAGPQVDLLVLHPAYPKHLLDKKLYLASGVAAAFEVKITLRSEHIRKTADNAVGIRRLLPIRTGTPYRELHSPMLYGLLAHSHSWEDANSKPVPNIDKRLLKADEHAVTHPREMLDVLCVADLATWNAVRTPWFGPENVVDWDTGPADWFGASGAALTGYMCHSHEWTGQPKSFTPIGTTVAFLWRQLAWEDTTLRPLADYFNFVLAGAAVGNMRRWPLDVYSEGVRDTLRHKSPKLSPRNTEWNEWGSDM